MVARCLVLLSLFVSTSTAMAAERPNIVFVLSDDIGVEALGCYGGESYPTPRLDELAKGGTRFEHCYSMPVCHPSRVCLLTGRYPFRLGHPKWGSFRKQDEQATFAQLLKKAGYHTAVAGKWQLTLLGKELDHPYRLGFDEYSLFGWHEGPRYHQPLIWQNGKRRDDVADRYGPDVYVDFLLDFARRHREKPFLLYYSMALCHDVTDDLKAPVPHGPKGRYESYAEMVAEMDREVGRLVDGLDELGVREKTLILFTGDNGTPTASYLRALPNGKLERPKVVSRFRGETIPGGKGSLADGGTLVPLIANWPGTVTAGSVADDLVDFSDFLPTFAQVAGVKPPDGIDGRSFGPRLLHDDPAPRTWAFAEHRGKSWVRDRRFKLYSDGRFVEVPGRIGRERRIEKPNEVESVARGRLAKALKALRTD